MTTIESVLPSKSFEPLPLEGADERSEAGLVSPNVGVPFHATNLRPFGAPPSKGRREKKRTACIIIGIVAAKPTPSLLYPLPQTRPCHFFSRGKRRGVRHMWGKREFLTANDNNLISASFKIIRAPSSGRGRRAKRGGVGFPECGSTVSRGQPPPLRGTSFQRKEGEKRR